MTRRLKTYTTYGEGPSEEIALNKAIKDINDYIEMNNFYKNDIVNCQIDFWRNEGCCESQIVLVYWCDCGW